MNSDFKVPKWDSREIAEIDFENFEIKFRINFSFGYFSSTLITFMRHPRSFESVLGTIFQIRAICFVILVGHRDNYKISSFEVIKKFTWLINNLNRNLGISKISRFWNCGISKILNSIFDEISLQIVNLNMIFDFFVLKIFLRKYFFNHHTTGVRFVVQNLNLKIRPLKPTLNFPLHLSFPIRRPNTQSRFWSKKNFKQK